MTARPSSADTRGRILAAATTMLAENPAARLSVRAVAQRAGVSTGSLRHFFPTQVDLIDAVVATLAALQNAAGTDEPLRDTERPAAERLQGLLQRTLHDALADDRALTQLRALMGQADQTRSDDHAASLLAVERLGVEQLAGWVTTLRTERATAEGVPADRVDAFFGSTADEAARFLSSVLTGLVTEHALPGSLARRAAHESILRIAATAVLTEHPSP